MATVQDSDFDSLVPGLPLSRRTFVGGSLAAVVEFSAEFDDPGVGAAAAARWLAAKGAESLRYEVYGYSTSEEEGD